MGFEERGIFVFNCFLTFELPSRFVSQHALKGPQCGNLLCIASIEGLGNSSAEARMGFSAIDLSVAASASEQSLVPMTKANSSGATIKVLAIMDWLSVGAISDL